MAEIVTRIGKGAYRVETGGVSRIVYVAGPAGDRWAFWNGRVFRDDTRPKREESAGGRTAGDILQQVEAPMPATVIKVLVAPGAVVKKGDTLVLLEAMKMELPIRAENDARVTAVHCRDGARVEAGAVLIELQ